MHLTVHRVSAVDQVPEALFWAVDGEDTRFICAFDHYPDTLQYVVAAWAITGVGELPEDASVLLQARGVSWNVYEHRGSVRREPGQLLPFPDNT